MAQIPPDEADCLVQSVETRHEPYPGVFSSMDRSEILSAYVNPARELVLKRAALIEQELAVAEAAWKDANEGRARVCARRAVALATDWWLDRHTVPRWRGDAMEHLRRIQQDASFPLAVREAAERLSTAVTKRHAAPFSTDPISDARLIIEHLLPKASSE